MLVEMKKKFHINNSSNFCNTQINIQNVEKYHILEYFDLKNFFLYIQYIVIVMM
jgi:hypothetical protein